MQPDAGGTAAAGEDVGQIEPCFAKGLLHVRGAVAGLADELLEALPKGQRFLLALRGVAAAGGGDFSQLEGPGADLADLLADIRCSGRSGWFGCRRHRFEEDEITVYGPPKVVEGGPGACRNSVDLGAQSGQLFAEEAGLAMSLGRIAFVVELLDDQAVDAVFKPA